MKRTVVLLGVVTIVLAGFYAYTFLKQPVIVQNHTVTEEVIVEKDKLEGLVESALSASSSEHHQKAQEAYDAELNRLQKELEIKVIEAYQAELDARQTILSKEIGLY